MIDRAVGALFPARRNFGTMSMHALRINVDVVMERVPLTNRWVSEQWRPCAVLVAGELNSGGGHQAERRGIEVGDGRWRFAHHSIELHPTEAEGYFLNLTSPAPCVFVMWRPSEDEEGAVPPVHPVLVTVSYNEAGRLMDGGERVDSVAMPAEIAGWMRPFVATHYKPEPRKKVRRNDPFADGASTRPGKT